MAPPQPPGFLVRGIDHYCPTLRLRPQINLHRCEPSRIRWHEAGVIATAPAVALVDSIFPLIKPATSEKKPGFDVLQRLGSLSSSNGHIGRGGIVLNAANLRWKMMYWAILTWFAVTTHKQVIISLEAGALAIDRL
ncbi:hypothetical protein FB451DRAFT_1418760 [Mycena latifolia]|nr:hypothetical protein FB451DRAFT_1418760 [Mycena latifolia]